MLYSGGAVHTPQILMLSGIGPASVLNKYNIPVLIDSPGVGANLADHPMFALRLKEKLGISFNFSKPYDLTSTFKLLKALTQYKIFGTGPLSSNVGSSFLHAFARSPTRPRLEKQPPFSERTIRSCSLLRNSTMTSRTAPPAPTHLILRSSLSPPPPTITISQ